jgi:hypothetical protein
MVSSEPVCEGCGNVFPNMFGTRKKKQNIMEMNKPLVKFLREKVYEYKNGGSSGFSKIDIIKRNIPLTSLGGREYHATDIIIDANKYDDIYKRDFVNEGATSFIGKIVTDIAQYERGRVQVNPTNDTERLAHLIFYYSPPTERMRDVCKKTGKKPFQGYFHIFESGCSKKAIRHEHHAEYAWWLERNYLGNKQNEKDWGSLAQKKNEKTK